VTKYSSDTSFDQEIRIKRMLNALAVLWDPQATELDKSDARFLFVIDRMDRESFKERWPKATMAEFDDSPASLGTDITEAGGSWAGQDDMKVAEYWRKRSVKKMLGIRADGSTQFVNDAKPGLSRL